MLTLCPPSDATRTFGAFCVLCVFGAFCLVNSSPAEVVEIHNTALPSGGLDKIELEEIWRAGGDDDEVFFGTIGGIDTDKEGNIYLLDGQLAEIHVYSPDGEHLRTLSRQGDGPGESRNPGALLITDDGLIHILQTFPGKVIMIDQDDTPAGNYSFTPTGGTQSPFAVMLGIQEDRDGLLIMGINQSFNQAQSIQTNFVARCDRDGNEINMLLEKENIVNFADFRLDEGKMDFVWARTTVDADGRVYIAPDRNEYMISVFDVDGNEQRRISREYVSPPRTDQQKQVARQIIEAVAGYYPAQLQGLTIEAHEPVITSMWMRPDESLWVASSHDSADDPEGAFLVVDEFSSDGDFRRQVALMCAGDRLHDAIFLLDEDLVVVVAGALDAWLTQQAVSSETEAGDAAEHEAAPLEIICYRMK